MTSPRLLHRLPHRVDSGLGNMERDHALLDWVSRGASRLVFRTYGWERPTLSLGRSEPYPEGWDAEALARAGIEVVRRPTGGNAVLHVEEVTFALAASIPGPWALTPRGFADAAAASLALALERCGVEGSGVAAAARGMERGSLCFARSAPGEVLAGGFKVAGIASRFSRSGALCHASVPLTAGSRSIARYRVAKDGEGEALERNARSLGELAGARDPAAIGDMLARTVASRFGARIVEDSFETVETACHGGV